MAMDSKSRPLDIFFLPYFTASHFIPVLETARLFAARGQNITLITTPSNASCLRSAIDRDPISGHRMSLHVLPFLPKNPASPTASTTSVPPTTPRHGSSSTKPSTYSPQRSRSSSYCGDPTALSPTFSIHGRRTSPLALASLASPFVKQQVNAVYLE